MNEIERMPLNSDLLRSFLVIAQSGNLTHAADRLGRTQSAVSVQLRNLENSLGTQLFERSVKGMRLTHAGERLLPKAEAAVAQLQDMRQMFDAPLVGLLRIGIPDDYEDRILTQALARFARRNPGVDVQAVSGCTMGYGQAVRDGLLDMAVCSGPDVTVEGHLSTERVVWAGSKSLRMDPETPLPLAMLDRACWWKSIPTDALKTVNRDFQIVFRSESFGSLLSALKAGLAVGVLPASCVTEDMTVFDPHDGFPQLPEIHRAIRFAPDGPDDIACNMAEAIRAAL